MEWLSTLFLGAFLFGLLFTVASMLIGLGHFGLDHHGFHLGGHEVGHLDGGHDVGHVGGHFGGGHDASHVGGAHHAGTVGDGGEHATAGISPWNLTSLTAFIAWFGGAGYLALTGWHLAAWISLLLAGLAGLVGWGIIYAVLVRLVKAEHRMDPADYRLEGTVARVTRQILADKIGEIQFTKGGGRRSEGARSLDGSAIARDSEVVVVRYERGIAYVQPWQQFVDSERTSSETSSPSLASPRKPEESP
jgi:hypothetical protein